VVQSIVVWNPPDANEVIQMSNPKVAIDHSTPLTLAELVASTVVDERRATVIATPATSATFSGWGPRVGR